MPKMSRVKGKTYERRIANFLTMATDWDWETTRNSGRTDLWGDVYNVEDLSNAVVVECKHRKTMTTKDVIKGNQGYRNEMLKVVESVNALCELLVFRRDEYGDWLWWRGYPLKAHKPVHTHSMVRGPDGRRWLLVDGLSDAGRSRLEKAFAGC